MYYQYGGNTDQITNALQPSVNWIFGTANAANAANTMRNGSKLGGWFNKAKSWGSQAFPNAKAGVKNFMGGTGAFAPGGFDYSFRANGSNPAGLKLFGKNVGRGLNIASGVLQGLDAAKGIADYSKANATNDDLMSDIVASAAGNPLLSSYLTPDQLRLLRQVRDGSYDASSDANDFIKGMGSGLGNAAIGALMGIPGGLPGMLIGGIGGLVNGGIDGLSAGTEDNYAELSALYQALMDAEAQYRSMKRPNFTGLGIQQQYQNMYA